MQAAARNSPAPGARGNLEAERRHLARPDLAQQIGQDGVATRVAEIAQFAMQQTAGQLWKRCQALAQIGLEGPQLRYPGLAPTVARRLRPLCDVSTHCLAVERHHARDGRNADTLAMQLKNHDDLPKSDQRPIARRRKGDIIAYQHRLLAPEAHAVSPPGEFQPAQVGIIRPALTTVVT